MLAHPHTSHPATTPPTLPPPPHRELSEGQRFALSAQLLPCDLTPGMELCLPGGPTDAFWLLHEGEVQVRWGAGEG